MSPRARHALTIVAALAGAAQTVVGVPEYVHAIAGAVLVALAAYGITPPRHG